MGLGLHLHKNAAPVNGCVSRRGVYFLSSTAMFTFRRHKADVGGGSIRARYISNLVYVFRCFHVNLLHKPTEKYPSSAIIVFVEMEPQAKTTKVATKDEVCVSTDTNKCNACVLVRIEVLMLS